jgi:hypothetical protein
VAKLFKSAMDVGLDGSNGLASGNRDLFVSETNYMSQDDRPAAPRRESLESSMPGAEVDIVWIV